MSLFDHISPNIDEKQIINFIKIGINFQDSKGMTALMWACLNKKRELAEVLIDAGADISIKDKNGDTALHYMLYFHFSEANNSDLIIKILNNIDDQILQKINISTALASAVGGSTKVVKKLIDKKADVNWRSTFGSTPLILAARRNEETTQILIDAKADVNLQNKFGDTALLNACKNYSENIAIKLIDAGADVDFKNENNEIAIAYINDFNLTKVLLHLKSITNEKILEQIQNQKSIISNCFQDPIADFNVVDMIFNFIY